MTHFFLHPHARGHPEAGHDGGKDGDDDVQDFAPKLFVFHDVFGFK